MRKPVILGAAALLAAAPTVRAAFMTIYGAPAYNPTTQTGYKIVDEHTPPPNVIIGAGATGGNSAVGFETRYVGGYEVDIRALRWNQYGSVELGNLGTSADGLHVFAEAYAINANNTAVGTAGKLIGGVSYEHRAVRWDGSNIVATELGNIGTIGGHTMSEAWAVNSAGTAVGFAAKYANNTTYGSRAVRWNYNTTAATELGTLGTDSNGTTNSAALAVNASGVTLGNAEKYTNGAMHGYRGVRWDATTGAAQELGLNNAADPYDQGNSTAYAINDSGTAVGVADYYTGSTYLRQRAVRWDAGTSVPTLLGNLGTAAFGVTDTYAYAINAAGTTVGAASKYVNAAYVGQKAVRWNAGGTAATELADLPGAPQFTATTAYGINSSGWVVGNTVLGGAGSAYQRALLWRPDGTVIDLTTAIDPSLGWTQLLDAHSISDSFFITGVGLFDPDGTGPAEAYKRAFLIEVPEAATLGLIAGIGLLIGRRRRGGGLASN